jgi:hypothetical protein
MFSFSILCSSVSNILLNKLSILSSVLLNKLSILSSGSFGLLLLGNLTTGFFGSCFFFLLFMATIPKANPPNGTTRSRSSQLNNPKFVDPESSVFLDVDVDVGVGDDVAVGVDVERVVDVEGTIEIGVDVGVFVNGVGLTVEVGVGVGVGVEVNTNVAEIE